MGTLVLVDSLKAFAVCGAAALVFSLVGLPGLAGVFALMMVSAVGCSVVSMFLPGFGA